MSWHQVQHPQKIVCLPFIRIITSCPLNVASTSSVPPYMIDCHLPALHKSSLVKSPCHIATVASLITNQYSKHPACHQSTASMYSSNHCRSRPSTVPPKSLNNVLKVCSSDDHGLEVHIYNLTQSLPPSVSPFLLSHEASMFTWLWPAHVRLKTCSITVSECRSKFTISQWPSVSPFTLYLASNFMFNLATLQPQSVSLSSLDRHFQAHVEFLSSTTRSQSRYTMHRSVAI
jgi:hypothetical protein